MGALLATIRRNRRKQPRRVIVAFAGALVAGCRSAVRMNQRQASIG
jgi:hypothetical protein